jgi:UPF0755 protein
MKRKILLSVLVTLLLLAAIAGWKLLGPTVRQPDKKYFYIRTGETYNQVKRNLLDSNIIGGEQWFAWASQIAGFKTIKPGRYEIKKGSSLLGLARMLKNGQQSPVNFVVTKIRTKETLAARIGNSFECDSAQMMQFLTNVDSLQPFGLDTNTVMAAVLPLTYTLRWTTSPGKIFREFYVAYEKFWDDDRKQKAEQHGITPVQVSTLASIIDEETNATKDKPVIASVYLNRVSKGMPLQADPTLKYALRNFGLKRLYDKHKEVNSPYNTYMYKAIPPGPICTPQIETLEAVLNSPKTDYLYFVASSNFDGSHTFTTNYNDHLKYARIYQQELNKRNIK